MASLGQPPDQRVSSCWTGLGSPGSWFCSGSIGPPPSWGRNGDKLVTERWSEPASRLKPGPAERGTSSGGQSSSQKLESGLRPSSLPERGGAGSAGQASWCLLLFLHVTVTSTSPTDMERVLALG